MEEKNIVINNYAGALLNMVSSLNVTLSGLGTETETNTGLIKTAYIQITAINSQLVVLQNEIDKYGG